MAGQQRDSKKPIIVFGGGSWGTALAILLANAGQPTQLFARTEARRTQMQQSRANALYLPDIVFPDQLTLSASTDLVQAVQHSDTFLLVVPSHAFRANVEALHAALVAQQRDLSSITLMWGSKGFDPSTGDLLSEVVQQVMGDKPQLAVVTGPSFAMETAKGLPTALVLAAQSESVARTLVPLFKTATTRVYPSSDLIGAQLGGAVKNVIAVAAGISDGLGYGANARTALITRGLAELTRFGTALGGKLESFMGLAGMGDLVLTCTDNQSRNRRLGLGVGAGRSAKDVIAEIGQEVESFNTTKELHLKAQALGISMPITEQVYAVLHQGRDPSEAVKQLLSRKVAIET